MRSRTPLQWHVKCERWVTLLGLSDSRALRSVGSRRHCIGRRQMGGENVVCNADAGCRTQCAKIIEGCWLALDPLRHPKTGMGPLLTSFLVGMGPCGRSGGSKFRRGTLILSSFSWFGLLFLEVKKYKSVNIREIKKQSSRSTEK